MTPRSQQPQRDTGSQNAKRKDVGYKQPPREHQFKPGISGNPSGKRKGTKNCATILEELMNRKVRVRGGSQAITLKEAIYERYGEDALKGNLKSLIFMLKQFAPFEAKDIARTAAQARFDAIPKIEPWMTAVQASAIYMETLRIDDVSPDDDF